ncbi:hypothetical protein PHSY_006402 [Pseudozyma hubeiensis SY62]|uniref:Uncharacterized protein n=1 Tax=Pseudozyma hubeiensis (strain SY62) TaxID=1305764 RepID=R9PC61_PSEHS|nr:hypothetical protein PHSY_006402 [Pseudozyma hubeiensis SY62]GAC98807.1 hypothetical protein PHSY_006402 [Pseudozyma hubeiensis SY62]
MCSPRSDDFQPPWVWCECRHGVWLRPRQESATTPVTVVSFSALSSDKRTRAPALCCSFQPDQRNKARRDRWQETVFVGLQKLNYFSNRTKGTIPLAKCCMSSVNSCTSSRSHSGRLSPSRLLSSPFVSDGPSRRRAASSNASAVRTANGRSEALLAALGCHAIVQSEAQSCAFRMVLLELH